MEAYGEALEELGEEAEGSDAEGGKDGKGGAPRHATFGDALRERFDQVRPGTGAGRWLGPEVGLHLEA
jgi:hypothetical protein